MRNTKRRMETFSIFNHTGISAHLEKMALKGWMLESIRNNWWIYRRIEPKPIHFAVSYYPKASEYDPEPSPEQQDFLDFCAHTGWQLVCTSAQMQIFCNALENPVPIDTDPVLEVETIHEAMLKNFLPAQIVLLVLGCILGWFFLMGVYGNVIYALTDVNEVFLGLCWLLIILLVSTELIAYHRWHKKAEEAAEQGFFLDTPDTRPIQNFALVLLGIGIVYLLVNTAAAGDDMRLFLFVAMAINFTVLRALVDGTKRLLKRWKVRKNVNRLVTLIVDVVLAVGLMVGVTLGTLQLNEMGLFKTDRRHGADSYWSTMDGTVPLKVEDMMEVNSEDYIYIRGGAESIFLSRYTMEQRVHFDKEDSLDLPTLEYTVVNVKMPFLYDMTERQIIKQTTQADRLEIEYELRDKMESIDPIPWGADKAYRVYNERILTNSNRYVLYYGTMFVDITFDWEPNAEQKQIVGECLTT